MLPKNYNEIIGNVSLLEDYIRDQSNKYYSDGSNELTDPEFDALVDILRKVKPNSTVLNTGWGFEVKQNKIKHKYCHIGSLAKCKKYDEIPDRFKSHKVYISPKLDGLSAVAYYQNGILVKGITRGNGEYGQDITEKLNIILGNKIKDNSFTGAVRGELIINTSNWEILRQKYKDQDMIAPRNFAAGIINRKDIDEDIQYLDLVVYKIVGLEQCNTLFKNKEDIINWLKDNFKCAIPVCYYNDLNINSWESTHLSIFNKFLELGYCLDGLVLTKSDIMIDNNNGVLYDEVAFKFKSDSASTRVVDIEWNLSRTDRLVPVAIVEPVELSGAIVTRCTCNNAKMVVDLGIGKDAEVEICRSGEVIPKILSIINPSNQDLPELCPCCHQKLVWSGVDLKCDNVLCPNKALSDLQQWCETVGETDGLQWTLMKQYLDLYGIIDINKLYIKRDTIWKDLNTRQLTLTELKIREFFDKLYFKPVELEKALIGLNIPRLGQQTAKILAQHFDLIYQLLLLSTASEDSEILMKLNGDNKYKIFNADNEGIRLRLLELVKEATTETILSNVNKFSVLKYLYDENYSNSRIVYNELNKDIKYVAVTGNLNTMKRKDFEKYILQFGYELSSSLKKCEYLITNTPDSGSSKNKQALQYNIPILTEIDFLNKLK